VATPAPPSAWRQALTRNPAAPTTSPTALLVGMVIVVGALYLGSEILIPLALALLLSFMLAPIVTRLRRLGLGRIPSVLIVVVLVFTALLGVGSIVGTQIVDLATNLPRYEWNLRSKIRDLSIAIPSGGVVEQTSEMLRDLSQELEEATTPEKEAESEAEVPPPEPVPVQVQRPAPTPIQTLREIGGPLVAPIATAGLVVVFVIFMLLQREDLRDRIIRLVGASDVARTTEAMNDAAKRISRYLLMQLVINLLYGIPVGVGLYFIGVPNPILWGLLATILRFIPYVGPVIAALFPIALSFAVAPGWSIPLMTIALFVVLELFSNNVLEPWLYGTSTGLSPVAVLVAAVFWTTLWGPVGLLLSTPLTVCLVVLGRHVPQLGFFDVLLGDEPALAPEVKFYQRLLAHDPEEAEEIADEYLEEEDLEKLYDAVIMPALGLAEQDRLRGTLDRATVNEIAEEAIVLIDDLAAEHAPELEDAESADVAPERPAVLCIGARNGLDEAAAAMLAQMLARRGFPAATMPHDVLSGKNIARLREKAADMVCLCYVNPAATQHAHRVVRRLRQHFGSGLQIMVGLCTPGAGPEERRDLLEATGADYVATSLWQAIRHLEDSEEPEETEAAPSAA
jgi:predicted PurR-regulated permease PerM/CheY-like chemotaxis protein